MWRRNRPARSRSSTNVTVCYETSGCAEFALDLAVADEGVLLLRGAAPDVADVAAMAAALLLRLILEDPTSVPFRLNEEFEEDYLEVIERPMDLTTIHNKMDTYDDLAAFARDVRSVFANAILYYTTRDEPVAKDATLLLKKFENRLAFEKSVAKTRAAEAPAAAPPARPAKTDDGDDDDDFDAAAAPPQQQQSAVRPTPAGGNRRERRKAKTGGVVHRDPIMGTATVAAPKLSRNFDGTDGGYGEATLYDSDDETYAMTKKREAAADHEAAAYRSKKKKKTAGSDDD